MELSEVDYFRITVNGYMMTVEKLEEGYLIEYMSKKRVMLRFPLVLKFIKEEKKDVGIHN